MPILAGRRIREAKISSAGASLLWRYECERVLTVLHDEESQKNEEIEERQRREVDHAATIA